MTNRNELLYLYELVKFARTGPRWAPKRLSKFIAQAGGIKDQAGDVSKLTGGKRQRLFGLIDNVRGMTLDYATLVAWEAGYIVAVERPTPADFLDVLDQDLNVAPVYSANDFESIAEFNAAEDARNELEQMGLLAPNKKIALKVEDALLSYASA